MTSDVEENDVEVRLAKAQVELEKVKLDQIKATNEQIKIRNEGRSAIVGHLVKDSTLTALVLSILIVSAIGAICYGCQVTHNAEAMLNKAGFKIVGPPMDQKVVPIEKEGG